MKDVDRPTSRADCGCDLSVGPNAVHLVDGHPDPRPSVTDNARAEAEKRWPRYDDDAAPYSRGAFIGFLRGAEWAAGRAETTTEATERIARQIAATTVMTGMDAREYVEAVQALEHAETTDERVVHNHGPTDGPGLDCPETTLPDGGLRGACLNRAETTTATTEAALREQVGRAVSGVLWNASNHPNPVAVLGKDVGPLRTKVTDAVMDVLATARTRPTREQIARALREGRTNGLCTPGVRCDLCDCAQDYEDDLALRDADAVLALLGGDNRG